MDGHLCNRIIVYMVVIGHVGNMFASSGLFEG